MNETGDLNYPVYEMLSFPSFMMGGMIKNAADLLDRIKTVKESWRDYLELFPDESPAAMKKSREGTSG